MKAQKSVLITDLDNTLFDWVHLWHACFSAMFQKIVEISGLPTETLKSEIRRVHQLHGTSEYAFLIEEIPSLRNAYPNQDLTVVFAPALTAYREERRKELRLYPTVAESLLKIKGTGARIIGYTESMAFYSNYRIRRLGLDGVFDVIFSPKDHELPKGMSIEQMRKYPADQYSFQQTKHLFTPPGELKPNKDILLSIVSHLSASVDDCVYVGDSLFKDVAMAKDALISDVWAKYGQSQDTQGYQLLREVTHWSDADVEREKRISLREIKPSVELTAGFSDLFDTFRFGNGKAYYELADHSSLSVDEKRGVIEIWKTVVDVQQHFNDVSLRIRGLFITLILALSAAIGFLAEKDLKLEFSNITVHYAMFVPLGGIVGTLLFYFIDRYWYHRLLIGAVNQGAFIEKRHRFEIPELGLTNAIGAASPIKLTRPLTKLLARFSVRDEAYKKNNLIHSTGKIELFYKPVVYVLSAVFLIMLATGGIFIGKSTLIDLGLERYRARHEESGRNARPVPEPSPASQTRSSQPPSKATLTEQTPTTPPSK